MHGQDNYLKCLKMQHKELENILKRDDAHWVQNLKTVKGQKKKFSDEMSAFLEKQ